MRHRINNFYNGLGNSEPVKLDNNIQLEKSEFWDNFLESAIKNFKNISNYDGFDFHIDKNGFTFGIEPSYKFDDLQIIHFNFNDKSKSYIEQGRAWGYYGTKCATKTKLYADYKNKSKFIRFIDEWYDKLYKKVDTLTHQHEDRGE